MSLLAKAKAHYMGLCDEYAKAAFLTDEQGRRLFCPLGFWSRPYLIPDAATEAALYQRHITLMQWRMGAIFLVAVGPSQLWPAFHSSAGMFFGSLVVLTALCFVGEWLAHRTGLSKLHRIGRRMTVRQFHANMAARHTSGQMVLRLLLSLGITAFGFWLLIYPGFAGHDAPPSIVWACVLMMGSCALGWGYALALKRER
jgi:hypothetical protein